MKRSAGVTVVAVFALLGSLLTLAMACLMGLAFLLAPADKSLDPSLQPIVKFGVIGGVIFFLALSSWGIASAIGLFRLRQWARISTLVFSGLLIFFGVTSPLFILAMPMPATPNTEPAIMAGLKFGIAAFYLCFAAVGVWWMVYLTRPSIKAQFAAGVIPSEPSRRPVSIAIIGWILIVCACFVPINLVLHFPLLIFGLVLTGWTAAFTLVFLGVISILAGIGLLRLKPEGRLLAIAYFIFGLCNGLVTWVAPGYNERFARMLEAMPEAFRNPAQPHIDPRFYSIFAIPFVLLPLYFLIKHKKAFGPPPPPAPELPASFPG